MTGKKMLLLNVLILAGILVCAQELISGWQRFESEQNLGQVMSSMASGFGVAEESAQPLTQMESLQHDFFIIAANDLFSPERRAAAVDAAEEAAEQAPEFPKKPMMTGVTESGGQRMALLTTFESKKDAAGRTEVVGLGEIVQGYVVTEITDTTLTLAWNDHLVVVDMLDSEPSKPVAKAPANVAALNIIRIGSKVAAVETTAPEAAEADENRGLKVGVVGGQTAGSRSGSRTGLAGRGGAMGRGSSGTGNLGRMNQGIGSQGRGLPSNVGGFGGSGRGLPNQQRPY